MQPPISPMTLGNMRENGVRSLVVHCSNVTCRHEAILNADGQSDTAFVPALGQLVFCQKCVQRSADFGQNFE